MAIYDFHCTHCKKNFSIEQSMKDVLPTDCPYCKAKGSLKQNYHATPVVFKGSGFYCTDNHSASGN